MIELEAFEGGPLILAPGTKLVSIRRHPHQQGVRADGSRFYCPGGEECSIVRVSHDGNEVEYALFGSVNNVMKAFSQ